MLMRLISAVILALAIAGAPFGMGRMMDTAHDMHAMHGMTHDMSAMNHDMDHDMDMPRHDAAAPHFMVCAACVAAMPQSVVPVQIAVLTGVLKSGHSQRLQGMKALPDLPPPRA